MTGASARRAAIAAIAILWGAALAWSAISARVLYGDGAWYVLIHLLTPYRFNDYDAQRTFASLISQAPVLLGQKLGFDRTGAYAALYSVGIFVIPAAAMIAALVLGRRQRLVFAVVALAIPIWGFGINFINSEANLMFGFAWLAAAILALRRPAPLLQGIVLPALGVALLRSYEGMLLAGPVLGAWAALAARRTFSEMARVGLVIASLLFFLAAAIGFGGFIAPRDPNNAQRFAENAFAYLRGPHLFLLLSTLAAFAATWIARPAWRSGLAAASALLGLAFVYAIWRLQGYYSFSVYYQNRTFIVLVLPLALAALAATDLWRPAWLAEDPDAATWRASPLVAVIPLAFAVAGDLVGTHRWNQFMGAFCQVLDMDATPLERLRALKASGARTAWAWTHPSMSVLLRPRGSQALVVNEPGAFSWEPFRPEEARAIPYRGICQAPLLGAAERDTFGMPIQFTGAPIPTYVASMSGLSATEGWATWSVGPRVAIRFARPLPAAFDLRVRVANAFSRNRELPVKVKAGNVEREFVAGAEPREVVLQFRGVRDASELSFDIPSPQSPEELGQGNDPRKLGIALVSMTVVPRAAQDN